MKNLLQVIEVKELWNVHCPLSLLNVSNHSINYQMVLVGSRKNKPHIGILLGTLLLEFMIQSRWDWGIIPCPKEQIQKS